MIAVIDYGAGNTLSVGNALERLGANYILTCDKKVILSADKVIFPGVGDASYAMNQLRERDLIPVIKSITKPFLGICLGMQLLCTHSEEGDTDCLDIIPNMVRKLSKEQEQEGEEKLLFRNKIPNIGWCELEGLSSPLFRGLKDGDFVYFVHSYAAEVNSHTIAIANHNEPFSAALSYKNFYGVQFHPEKSGKIGEKILSNFLNEV